MDCSIEHIRDMVARLKLTRRINQFSIDLYFLNKGLKPSILWDFGRPDKVKMLGLQTLFDQKLIILDIGGDIFIVFRPKVVCLLEQFVVDPPVILDISEHIGKPVEVEEVEEVGKMSRSVLEQVNSNSSVIIHVTVEESWNLSTLFGILLGFPVVYYYSVTGGNCLDNRDLNVRKIGATLGSSQAWPVSFSVPAELEKKVGDRVSRWWDVVGMGNEWGVDFQLGELLISCKKELVNMPSVVL